MKNQYPRKLVAMLLCLSIVFSLLPVGALAAEQGENPLGAPPTNSSEASEELKDNEIKDDVEDEIKDDVDGEIKDDVDGEIKDDVDGEIKDDVDGEIKDDVDGEIKDDVDGEIKNEDVITDSSADDVLPNAPESSEDTMPEFDLAHSLRFAQIPGDAALTNTWTQDIQTDAGGEANGAIAEVRDGALYMISGSANQNNGDATPPPAVFVNETMNAKFVELYTADNQAIRAFEMDITPSVVGGAQTNFGFGIYLNYQGPNNGLFLGYNTAGGWFWQQYGPSFSNSYGNFSGPVLTPGETYHVQFQMKGSSTSAPTSYQLLVDGAQLTQGGFTTLSTANGDSQKIGFKLGTYNGQRSAVTISNVHYTGQAADAIGYEVTGVVKNAENAPLADATVMINGKTYITSENGEYNINGDGCLLPGEHILKVYKDDYVLKEHPITVTDADLTGQDITLEAVSVTTETLTTDDMDVTVDTTFPRVIRYTMKGILDGTVMHGQNAVLDTVTINGVDVVPTVSSTPAADGKSITYTMTAKNEAKHIDAVITAELVAEGNTLSFNITNIDNQLDRLTYPVESVSIPNHSLISVRSTQEGANLIGNRLAANTITSGDFRYAADNLKAANNGRFIYAFIANNELSAGIASNSEWGTGSAASNNHRVLANAEDRGPYVSLGLSSSEWYYDRKLSSSDNSPINLAKIPAEDRVVGPTEMPLYVKVVVTGDENEDNTIDWQDGAIAARETEIIHIPAHSAGLADLISTRIAMNFGSQAQNPFLTSLDNVKRVYLNTDGLGQSVLLKGYGNEGHDSGHPDYADIGVRMGGAEDMNTMMVEGAKLGAKFGIHVNASEFYPEAKAFSDETLRYTDSGNFRYGWNWLDQGVGINGLLDLASGNRKGRFNALKDKVGDNLDFVYVDVWGNNTSGNTEDAWQTRKLSNEITSNGWRIVQEWGYANEWDSTFQHWVSDYTYGDYGQKGKYNSEVERFLLNSYKDTFVPDYPNYGGNANAPLLGGAVMQGFEGWQKDSEYDMSMEATFEHLIPSKFLQHYDIMKWVNAEHAVDLPYASTHNAAANSTSKWTPEVQITLQSADRSSTVVVTRGSDEKINATYAYGTDAERREYRSRTITLDGKEILRGAPNPAAGWTDYANGLYALADQQYLIPWLWDKDGGALADADQKLYHRNDEGGESTWDLPKGWENLATVKMYELTDNGRVNERVVGVTEGSVTLNAEAEVPYVIVKGTAKAAAPSVEWSTGLHLKDVGFNATNITDNWTVAGEGTAVRHITSEQLSVLKLNGVASVSQEYNDLTPGQKYVTYVSVDNRSDAKASMTVKNAAGEVLASNYTMRSIAKNYISAYSLSNAHPLEGGASYFQNMFVFFTAPVSGTVTLTLSREAGEGNIYFDDVRTLKTDASNLTFDDEGNLTKLEQDFEHVAQGQFPFVVGPGSGGVEDNYQHLSEKHAPYTQAGWEGKLTSDVLEGNWSVKFGDRNAKNNLTMQTIPQNFRFEPNGAYFVSFDYQMGTDGDYEVVYGVGPYSAGNYTVVATLDAAHGTSKTCKFPIIGDATGQTWIGLRRTNALPISPGGGSNADIFLGRYDFVLDNLVIERSETDFSALFDLIAEASAMVAQDYSGDWTAFTTALANAQVVMDGIEAATADEVEAAKTALEAAINALTRLKVVLSGKVTVDGKPVSGLTVELQDASYEKVAAVTTSADGSFTIPSGDLHIMPYRVKTSAPGCSMQSILVDDLVGNVPKTVNVELVTWDSYYAVNFNDDVVSMMTPLAGSALRRIETTHLDSGNALKQEYDGNALWFEVSSADRARNNLVNNEIQMINGTVSCDVIPLWTDNRFGFTLRGTDGDNRIFVGQFAGTSTWGVEFWGEGSSWSASYPGPSMRGADGHGELRHLEVTLDDSTITLKVDGVTVIDHLTMEGLTSGKGYVGFNHMNAEGAEFLVDNFIVIPADAAEADTHSLYGRYDTANAQVIVTNIEGEAITRTTTKQDGSFITLPIPNGTYTVTVTPPEGDSVGSSVEKEAVVDGKSAFLGHAGATADMTKLHELYELNKDRLNNGYTASSWETLQAALTAADAMLNNMEAAQSDVDAACNAITDAIEGLRKASSGGGSSNTATESTKNPDGSTTTTVTNKNTGTITETTIGTDGTKVVTQTKKDGSSTTVVTLTRNPVGTVTLPGKPASAGDTIAVKTDNAANMLIPVEHVKPGIVAVIIHADGTEELIKKSVTTADGVAFAIEGSAVIQLKDNSKSFVDVAASHWAGDAIAFATSRELFNGVGGDSFSPAGDMTRSMLITVLARLDGQETTGGETWYSKAMDWGVEAGITDGTNAEASITRESLAAMLYRYAEAERVDGTALSEFPDADQVSDWATEAMNWAVAKGIINGADGRLNPGATASRAEVATMLMRFVAIGQ